MFPRARIDKIKGISGSLYLLYNLMFKIIAKAPFVSITNVSIDFIKTKQVSLHSNFILPLKTNQGVHNTLRVNLERVD